MKNSKLCDTRAISLCSLFCSLIILGAYVRLPFPVPVTLQLLFTNTSALLLGKKWSWVPPLLYLTLGLAGLPVFTSGGGVSSVLSLSFGYCVGFIPGSLVAGIISDKDAGARSLTLASICNL
ncbi:MAG: biotin transporter BioY, partial [Clostridia bacterium]|nr:biotin transporter BioY [Clostridia bacterium]